MRVIKMIIIIMIIITIWLIIIIMTIIIIMMPRIIIINIMTIIVISSIAIGLIIKKNLWSEQRAMMTEKIEKKNIVEKIISLKNCELQLGCENRIKIKNTEILKKNIWIVSFSWAIKKINNINLVKALSAILVQKRWISIITCW